MKVLDSNKKNFDKTIDSLLSNLGGGHYSKIQVI